MVRSIAGGEQLDGLQPGRVLQTKADAVQTPCKAADLGLQLAPLTFATRCCAERAAIERWAVALMCSPRHAVLAMEAH